MNYQIIRDMAKIVRPYIFTAVEIISYFYGSFNYFT